jgi:hypothetical protein
MLLFVSEGCQFIAIFLRCPTLPLARCARASIWRRAAANASLIATSNKKAKIAMLCERSYDPLSRMLLKGDEGGCKIRRGGGRKWRFSPGGSLPLDDLSVTSNRESSLATQRSSTQRFMNGPSPAGTRSAPQAWTIPIATNPC